MQLNQDVFLGASALAELLDSFRKYRAQRGQEELKSPEWVRLEKAYTEHLLWRFEYPKRVYLQRVIATWVVVFIVLGMVGCGVAFAYMQLQAAIALRDFSSLKTDLALQTAGSLSLGSSVVGAVVLTISLLFFFLYLKHVFSAQTLVPPHLGLLETDAAKLYGKQPVSLSPELEAELEEVMRRHGHADNSYYLVVKPPAKSGGMKYEMHGATPKDEG